MKNIKNVYNKIKTPLKKFLLLVLIKTIKHNAVDIIEYLLTFLNN